MANRYWVGGSGNWSSTSHWSTSSGGSSGASVPSTSDDVFIDSNSGFGSGGTITISADANCKDITSNETGHAFKIDLYAGKTLTVAGTPLLKGTDGKLITLDATEQPDPNNPVVVDKYLTTDSGSNGIFTMYGAKYGKIGIAQSFTGDGGTLNSVKFYVYSKNGSPTGDVVGKIYAHSGTYGTSSVPTGDALAVSSAIDASSLSALGWATFTFTGTNKITLTNGTKYCVAIEYSGGNSSNNFTIRYKYSTSTHKGNESNKNYGGSYSADATLDTCFYVYKDGVATQHTLSQASGVVECNYLDISNSNATGGAAWYAGADSVDTINNTGWIFSSLANDSRSSVSFGGDGRYVEDFSTTTKKDAGNTTASWTGDGTAEMT